MNGAWRTSRTPGTGGFQARTDASPLDAAPSQDRTRPARPSPAYASGRWTSSSRLIGFSFVERGDARSEQHPAVGVGRRRSGSGGRSRTSLGTALGHRADGAPVAAGLGRRSSRRSPGSRVAMKVGGSRLPPLPRRPGGPGRGARAGRRRPGRWACSRRPAFQVDQPEGLDLRLRGGRDVPAGRAAGAPRRGRRGPYDDGRHRADGGALGGRRRRPRRAGHPSGRAAGGPARAGALLVATIVLVWI